MPRRTGRTRSIFRHARLGRIASLNSGPMILAIGGIDRSESHPPAANVHLPLVEDFVAAVRTGRAPAVDGHLGRAIAVIQKAIYADAPPVG
jgi:hypothetical protein